MIKSSDFLRWVTRMYMKITIGSENKLILNLRICWVRQLPLFVMLLISATDVLALPNDQAFEGTPPPCTHSTAAGNGYVVAHLVQQVTPAYPSEAERARIEGTVRMIATIGTDGTVSELKVLSGPPVLVPAAIAAVKQWRYRPVVKNGCPVTANTKVAVRFSLKRNGK